jgi:hypothetical protein
MARRRPVNTLSDQSGNGWQLLNEHEIAARLRVSVGYLRKDRLSAQVIPCIRIGDRALYDEEQVREALRGKAKTK